MKVHYLEVVTPDVDALCAQHSKTQGVEFGDPVAGLGNARTAELAGGGKIGIRAPMHDAEEPISRAYVLVDDIQLAVDAAAQAGAEVALPPMDLGEHGHCAIVIQGGIHCGFWQL
jgi:predicted enzyme related to lactoylglutathione lyase